MKINPFKIWDSWVGAIGILFVPVKYMFMVYALVPTFTSQLNSQLASTGNSVMYGLLTEIESYIWKQTNGITAGTFPTINDGLVVLEFMVIGFLIGWGIYYLRTKYIPRK